MLLEIWQDYRDESEKKSKGLGICIVIFLFYVYYVILCKSCGELTSSRVYLSKLKSFGAICSH